MYRVEQGTECWVLPEGEKKWQSYTTRKTVGLEAYHARFANWYIFQVGPHLLEVEECNVIFAQHASGQSSRPSSD